MKIKNIFSEEKKADWYHGKYPTGGIICPQKIVLPHNTYLFRFHDGDPEKEFGDWWMTPHELRLIFNFYHRFLSSKEIKSDLTPKTSSYKELSILNAVSAIRREWSTPNCLQLSQFSIITILKPIMAFYGEGNRTEHPNNSLVLLPEPIEVKGRRWIPRQVCLPEFHLYCKKVEKNIWPWQY